MRELTADLFASLDGFGAAVDAPAFFGYDGPELRGWARNALDQPQLILMGRVTYEAMSTMASSATDEFSTRMNDLPKAVFSGTLQEPLAWSNTRLITGDLAEEIGALKRLPGEPLRSIGSISLVKSMMRLGLVDRLRVMTFPLTCGDAGREPIYAGYPQAAMELIGTRILDSRLIITEYKPLGSAVS